MLFLGHDRENERWKPEDENEWHAAYVPPHTHQNVGTVKMNRGKVISSLLSPTSIYISLDLAVGCLASLAMLTA